MHPATVSAAFISHILDVAERHGCNAAQLLAEIGLDAEQLSDPIRRIPMQRMRELLAAACRASGIAHFGLLVGAAVRPGSYGGLGYVTMTSPTIRDSMSMIRRFGKIVFDSPSSRTFITVADGLVTLEDRRITDLEPYCISQVELVLAGWTAYGRWLAGFDGPLVEVWMMHADPGTAEACERFFGCPVHFNQPTNAVRFAESILDLPIQGADLRAHKSMLLEAEQQLGHSYAPFSTIGRVRSFLIEQLPEGEVSLEAVASKLAMSTRTLQRKLAAEGESFSTVLDAVRMELADYYLRSTDLSIMNIALTLGFSHSSAFSHAFRQLRSVSPADYRKAERDKLTT
ncbi:AraC family transcriptional regulator [Pseudomonas sp. UL073]|uniref:AraC family transcriptional regulator n=1 Tax=Zestomonas insulae TaxID=2809017 RepID=A0ABS2I9Z4_9GAMM|nr:AraC family transcriptional regulator [Pseudomonas insulae]MBM7059610.1 AraC family transcriptional regulator [Pseudomonas insulae]